MGYSRARFAAYSDTELIQAAPSDPAAFEELFERHSIALQGWLFAQTRDLSVSRELLAETFAQAWRSASRFRGEDDRSGGAWLYGIARHRLLKHHRRTGVETAARKRLGMRIVGGDDGGVDEIASRLDADDLGACLRAAFTALTSEQQQAIGYRVVDELSYEEVAARLGVNTTTARTRVFRGLQTLRSAIKGVSL
ncbi:MAG: RNA polymerase sigma factor [Solirubrobacteraceae bacterium]